MDNGKYDSKSEDVIVSRKSGSPVWEEALLEELLYAIGHLNHCEQHLIEADSAIQFPVFLDITSRLREDRKTLGQVLFALEKVTSEEGGRGPENGLGKYLVHLEAHYDGPYTRGRVY
jgi:hypothetical protein